MKSKGFKTVLVMGIAVCICPFFAYAFSALYVPPAVSVPTPFSADVFDVQVWDDIERVIDMHEPAIEGIMRDAQIKRRVIRSAV